MPATQHGQSRSDGQHLNVVILSTSKADEDIAESRRLNVNAYILKPIGFEAYSEAIRRINLFWEIAEISGGWD